MEFKYHAGQNPIAPSPMSRPLPTVTYMNSDISRHSLQGCEFVPSGFTDNAPMPTFLPTPVSVNVDEAFQQKLEEERIQRELQKEEIRREIIASEMALARRRELKEEVMREMSSERVLGIPKQRAEGILGSEGISMSFNPTRTRISRDNNINMSGGSHSQLPSQVDIGQPFNQTYKDQVIILPKPNANQYGRKRKAVTPPTIDDNEHSTCNLQKKADQVLRCALCQVAATSEKALNDHLQGRRHRAKEASLRTRKILNQVKK